MRTSEIITLTIWRRLPNPSMPARGARIPSPRGLPRCAGFATRWSKVEQIARHPDFTAVPDEAPVNTALGRPDVLTTGRPRHAELRGRIEPHDGPRRVAAYVDTLVRPIAEAPVQAFRGGGDNDLQSVHFGPVSALPPARSFGFLDVDRPILRRWFHGLSQGAMNFGRDPSRDAICAATVAEIDAVALPLPERLARAPDQSPLSHRLHAGIPPGQTRQPEHMMPPARGSPLRAGCRSRGMARRSLRSG